MTPAGILWAMATGIAAPSEAGTRPFEEDAGAVLRRLKSALVGVFAASPRPIRSATDVQRNLKLPKTLSWQLYGFTNSADPASAATLIPGPQAAARLLKAAADQGVAEPLLDRAAAAFAEFEACVERHAGSRAAFDSMVSALPAGEGGRPTDLDARREAFRALSHIYGVQVGATLITFLVGPGPEPGTCEVVLVNGFVNLGVMRPFEKLFIGRHGQKRNAAEPLWRRGWPIAHTPEEGAGADGPAPVLPGFSAGELPRFSVEPRKEGGRAFYISGPPVGRTGELTFFLAERFAPERVDDEDAEFDTTVLHPTHTQIHDVLVYPGFADPRVEPTTAVYGGPLHDMRLERRDEDRLRIGAQSVFVGRGAESLQTPIVPRYVEMLSHVSAAMGWNLAEFCAFRCQIEYPVLHSLLHVSLSAAGRRG